MERGAMQWLAAALAAGCVHAGGEGPEQAQALDPNEEVKPVLAQIQADLKRLSKLEMVAVVDVDQTGVQRTCYGLCPGDLELLRDVKAPRLKALVDLAEKTAQEPLSCEGIEADAEVAALADLQIVEVTGLMKEEAANNPNCYNLPCTEDIERAEAENCERLGALAALNQAAKDL